MTIRGLMLLLTWTLTLPAVAEQWIVQKQASLDEDGDWQSACQAVLGTYDAEGRIQGAVYLFSGPFTQLIRSLHGEERWQNPVLALWGRADKGGPRRDIQAPLGYGLKCTDDGCAFDFQEYRVRYSIDAGRARDAWVHQVLSQTTTPEGEERETALIYWPDYPPEVFETNERRRLRVFFPGLGRSLPDDTRRSLLHHQTAQVAFEDGLETRERFERCMDDHRRAGRLDWPPANLPAADELRELMSPGLLH